MRLMTILEAQRDIEYQNDYHYKLTGRVWNALEDTKYSSEHGNHKPNRFTFSNPFPPKDMEKGDTRRVIFASPDEELLAHIAADLLDNREFNIGEMPFRVDDIYDFTMDVGEPGTKGVLESGTGLHVTIRQSTAEEYGIEPDGNGQIYWKPKHAIHPFKDMLKKNLQQKHELYGPDHLKGPAEVDEDLFEEYDMFKQFSIPLQTSARSERTLILQKWRFNYQVRNNTHRRHLNLALNVGLGRLNGMGLGFMNIKEGSKEKPTHRNQEGTHAHTA